MRQQGCAQGTKRCHVACNDELSVQAALLPKGSMDRLLLVAAFAQSGFAAGLRPYKCLNPVMGETFEVCDAHTRPAPLTAAYNCWDFYGLQIPVMCGAVSTAEASQSSLSWMRSIALLMPRVPGAAAIEVTQDSRLMPQHVPYGH